MYSGMYDNPSLVSFKREKLFCFVTIDFRIGGSGVRHGGSDGHNAFFRGAAAKGLGREQR